MDTEKMSTGARGPSPSTSIDDGAISPASGAATGADIERDGSSAVRANRTDHGPEGQSALARVKSITQGLGQRPECFTSTLQEVSFVAQATIAMSTSTFLVGASSIVTASIGRDLGMTQGEISWIGAAANLTSGAFQLAVGQLADLLGRKLVYLLGMGSFCLLILLVGFAQNPFWMDIVLGVAGISCAMVVPPAVGILGAAYGQPSRRKNLAFSAFSAGNPLGFVLGSITCGVATRLFNWRSSFYFIAMLWGAFTLMAFWAVPDVEAFARDEPLRQRMAGFFKRFDSVGALLTLFGTGILTAGITLGPADGWKSPLVLCLMILGVALLALFVFWETKYPQPLMPPHIWRDRNFSFIIVVTTSGFMGFTASAFWLAYFMQEQLRWDALTVAVHLLPQAVAGLLWNVLIGHTLHRVNNTLIMAAGSLAYLAANLLLSLMKKDSSYWAFIFPALALNVVGADFQFNVANMYVMQSLPAHQQSLAGGIFNTLIRLSSTIALGVSTAVYSSVGMSPRGMAEPMLKYTRTFQVSVALAAVSCLWVPFVRLGTQGQAPRHMAAPLVDKGATASGQDAEEKAPE